MLESQDLHLFNEGTHCRLWQSLGAHLGYAQGATGTNFAVWAPDAEQVVVVGDFNHWGRGGADLSPVGSSGIWSGFVPGVGKGALYKYRVRSRHGGNEVEKTDPFSRR
jgi:1,4-alpha-glucan branching enzyme